MPAPGESQLDDEAVSCADAVYVDVELVLVMMVPSGQASVVGDPDMS